MRYLFTKSFFELSGIDQLAVIDSRLREIETANYIGERDRRRAQRSASYIRRRAVENGLMEANENYLTAN